MNCSRALEILTSIKDRMDIVCSAEEISELIGYSFIKQFKLDIPLRKVEYELDTLKKNYNNLNYAVREQYREMLSLEQEYQNLSLLSKLFSYSRLGKGSTLKRKISKIKKESRNVNNQITIIKDQILKLNADKKSIEQTVRVNGITVVLTPQGERMIGEIQARGRYSSMDLSTLNKTLEDLDSVFSKLIFQTGIIMSGSTFSAIWAIFLLNMDMRNLQYGYNAISNSDYNYNNSQKRMMDLSINALRERNLKSPKFISNVRKIEYSMRYVYQNNNPHENIRETLLKAQGNLYKTEFVVESIGKLFSVWSYHHDGQTYEIEDYMSRLYKIINQNLIPSLNEEENIYTALLLAFADNPDKFKLFKDYLTDFPEGANFFAAIATLFPWEPEEIWMLLRRAESNVLQAQSAKFIPELVEYALLLAMNVNILSVENNLPAEKLDKWKNLIIPSVHVMTFSYLEENIERYIRTRPLAYIISPIYYRSSSLHYHVIG